MTETNPYDFKPKLIWPISDEVSWKKEVARAVTMTKETEERIKLSGKQREELDAAALQHTEDLRKQKEERIRDQREQRKRIIDQRRTLLLNRTGGVILMAKKNKTEASETVTERPLKKTGLIDALLNADLAGSYGEGAVDGIAQQVMSQFEGLDLKKVRGLIFSRRAVLKKAATTVAA